MAAAPFRNNSRSLPKLHAFDNRVAFPYDALRMLAW